ncbi:MAG: hypothetical protein WC852_02950 [Candidatus Nanoarchaeia archaeon]|jgi:hypothetical protein
MNLPGKEVREWLVKNDICNRHLCLLEMIVEMLGDGGDVTTARITRRARTSHLYLEGCWHFEHDEKGELKSYDLEEDLHNMHGRGYIFGDGTKFVPTHKGKIRYEQIYGEGTFTFQPEKK